MINEKGNLFYSLLFYFNGCMVTNIESASQHKLNVLLRRLYNTNGIKILDIDIRDIDEKEKFDIIYLKNVFENKKYEYSIINKITNEFFILELENEREKDIIIENTDFKSYFPLRKIFSKNRQCEVGIFKK